MSRAMAEANMFQSSSSVAVAPALDVLQAAEDAPLRCISLPGGFGVLVHGLLFIIAIGVLVARKFKAGPVRLWLDFLLDASKQFIGSGWIWVLSVLCSSLSASTTEGDGCSWYWLDNMLDATLGVFIEYLLLNFISFGLETRVGKAGDLLTGEYMSFDGRFVPRMYVLQLMVWLGCVTGMKVVMAVMIWCFASSFLRIADFVLAIVSWSPEMKLIVVMVLTPCTMTAVQFWVTDSFLQKGGLPFTECGAEAAACLRSGVIRCWGSLIEVLTGTSRRNLEEPLIPPPGTSPGTVAWLERRLADKEQSIVRERQQAQFALAEERRQMQATRETLRREVEELNQAVRRQADMVNEEVVERQGLRSQVLALEERLAHCSEELAERDDELAAANETKAQLRNQIQSLASSAAAVARASPSAPASATAAVVASDVLGEIGGTAKDFAGEDCQEIVLLTRGQLARLTPDQVRCAAAERGVVLDRKLGNLEAKVRGVAWRTAAGGIGDDALHH